MASTAPLWVLRHIWQPNLMVASALNLSVLTLGNSHFSVCTEGQISNSPSIFFLFSFSSPCVRCACFYCFSPSLIISVSSSIRYFFIVLKACSLFVLIGNETADRPEKRSTYKEQFRRTTAQK